VQTDLVWTNVQAKRGHPAPLCKPRRGGFRLQKLFLFVIRTWRVKWAVAIVQHWANPAVRRLSLRVVEEWVVGLVVDALCKRLVALDERRHMEVSALLARRRRITILVTIYLGLFVLRLCMAPRPTNWDPLLIVSQESIQRRPSTAKTDRPFADCIHSNLALSDTVFPYPPAPWPVRGTQLSQLRRGCR
jgi:hypothetical protein